jgi:2-oxoisovalerate dehydrogenase E1 component alpha subunit
LGSVPQAALGSPALDTSRRGFCSVRRFAGESSAAAAAAAVVDEEPESGFAAGDQQVCVDQTSSWIDSELLV